MSRKREVVREKPKTPFDEINEQIDLIKDEMFKLAKRLEILEARSK